MKNKKFLVGFAIADAIGIPVEFKPREYLKGKPVQGMLAYGTYNKPAGTWSDDTTMTIATMESITRLKKIDYNDIMNNFSLWYNKGDFTIDGVFDMGNTTRRAIKKFLTGTPVLECGGTDNWSNGNGSLMRILPISIYLHNIYGNNFKAEAMDIIHNISGRTHAHSISKIACGLYCVIAAELMEGKTIQEGIAAGLSKGGSYYRESAEFAPILDEHFSRLFDEDFANLPESEIGSSGYVVHSLEASIWCLLNTNDYKSLILKAINLGEDTDTTGAIAAGLGGLVYKVEDLPAEWINGLREREYLERLEASFFNSLN